MFIPKLLLWKFPHIRDKGVSIMAILFTRDGDSSVLIHERLIIRITLKSDDLKSIRLFNETSSQKS